MAALIIIGAGIGIANAMSIPAFLGQPQNPADYSCFQNSFGTVVNTCSTTRRFCVSLPVDSSGRFVQANVLAPDVTRNVSCFAQAVTRDLFDAGRTPRPVSPSVFGVSQVLNLGAFSVPFAGALFACCDIAPGAALQTLAY
jgi:hypothetical protein